MSSNENVAVPRWQIIVSWVLSVLLLVPFLPSAFMKIAQPGDFLAQWSKGYPAGAARPLGIIELLCVILYLIPRTSVLGAILMTGYLGGAVATHVHMGEWQLVIAVIVGMIAWLALYLRMPLLRALVPTVRR
ncbi:MAG: hypothetical protein JWP97_784 [Labilithrix sp.]|nr:hypothetical protein [Labilithrix sp.]